MSPWQPCKRRVFIKRLRKLSFEGPFSGTRHQFMVFRDYLPQKSKTSMTLNGQKVHHIDDPV